MGVSVKPETTPHILSFDEWQATQYAPHRADQTDPTKPMGQGRILTFDEWQKAQAAGNPSTLQFPAMPKIASDATKRLNPNAGAPDATIGGFVHGVSGALDVAANTGMLGPTGAPIGHVLAAVGRQAIEPIAEHPLQAAAMANPVGAIVGLGMAAHTVARYGWQAVTEHFMTPEERAQAEADPGRVSGEAAAVQAAMLLLPILHVGGHALSTAADVSTGVTETGASGIKSLYETPKGAEVLGSAAGEKGLPITASPYPPDSPNDAAWKQGHASAAPALNVAPEGAAPPATPPEMRVVPPKIGAPEPGGPSRVYHGTKEAFGEFDGSKSDPNAKYGPGFYFTENPTKASGYAETKGGGEAPNVKVAGLTINKPFNIDNDVGYDDPEVQHILATAQRVMPDVDWDYGRSLLEEREQSHNLIGADLYKVLSKMVDENGVEAKRAGANQILKEAGYDGITHLGGRAQDHRVWIAFDKSQIGPPRAPAQMEPVPPSEQPSSVPTPAAAIPSQPAPVEGTGPTRTRGLAAGVEAKAVEAGLTARLGDLPEYRQLNMADQAAKATDLLARDPELARRVATGEAPAPEGLHPEAAFVAVENKAIAEGDVATIRDLASSKLTEQATTMGQRIRTLGERDPDSPVSAIQDIEEARGARTSGKPIDDMAASLLKQTAKAHPDVLNESTLAKLINSLRC